MFRSVRNKVIMTLCAVCMASALQALPAVAAEAFDPVFYAASNPDVVAVLGTDPQALLNHYLNYGIREGRLPYEGAQPGAAVDGIASPAAAQEPAPASSFTRAYIDRVPAMFESVYQSYVLAKTDQHAALVLPVGGTTVVDELNEEEGAHSRSWKEFVYEGNLYLLDSSYDSDYISIDITEPAMSYEDLYGRFGIQLPYVTHKFTQEDIQFVATLLDSPAVLQKDFTWPDNHIFSGNGRYDANTDTFIFGYYKDMPVRIILRDSFARYEPYYSYMPKVNIGYYSFLDSGMGEQINKFSAEGYHKKQY